MRKNLCLLYGGKSAEHEVSLQTAKAVIEAVNPEKYRIRPIFITKEGNWISGQELDGPVTDVNHLQFNESGRNVGISALATLVDSDAVQGETIFFPLLHGPNGEDGTVQGMLELLNVPYVGNGVLASSAGMDKVIMKNLFAHAGLDQVKYLSFTRHTWENMQEQAFEEVEKELGYPCFVKPANLGSSVGISKCENRVELVEAFEEAFKYDRKIIVEEGVHAREVEVGVLGNDEPQCSVVGEIIPEKEFYDYHAKYKDGNTALVIPADVSPNVYDEIKQMATTAFKALDCSGLARVDFFITKEAKILINEINTMPGFTPFSMFPLLWQESGVSYSDLIEKMVDLAIERYEEKQQIIHSF